MSSAHTETMPLYSALARGLSDHGVDTMFGLIGDANVNLVDRFIADEKKAYVAAAHEAGAVLMANGYAQRSGRLGVASITNGPALTNTLTALGEGTRARIPMVLLAGESPAAMRRFSPQDVPQRELVLGVGAGFEPVAAPYTALTDLASAIRRAHLERRPIVLNVPSDLMAQHVEYAHIPTGLFGGHPKPDDDILDRAADVLASACRPVVLLGRGVSAEARAAVLQLAERIEAPIATTLGGKGQLNGEPFSLGVFGVISTPVDNDVILSADCIVAFGASLNPFTTAGGSLVKDKAVIHCDADATAVGLQTPVDVGIVGDAGATATALTALLNRAEISASGFRSPALAQRLAQSTRTPTDGRAFSPESPIDIRTALAAFNSAIPAQRSVVFDGGRFMEQGWTLLDAPSPQAWSYAIAFGAIGLGMGTAIGASVAAPDEPIVCVCGDGGFMTGGITEFNTAVRHNLDVITIVCNDSAYGAEHSRLCQQGLDPAISLFNWPDLAPVADALGGRGVTVRTVADLQAAQRAIAERDRPLLIDVKLDVDTMPQLKY